MLRHGRMEKRWWLLGFDKFRLHAPLSLLETKHALIELLRIATSQGFVAQIGPKAVVGL